MPRHELVILALSRMFNGVCLAGIDEQTKTWIRPVLRFGDMSPLHICDRRGVSLAAMDLVALNTVEHRPSPPHVEDWLVDFARQRPTILGQVPENQRGALLESLLDTRPDEVLRNEEQRSLALIEPMTLNWVSFDPSNPSGNYEVRLEFDHLAGPPHPQSQSPGVPVTDLKLRAWGRQLLGNRKVKEQLSGAELQKRLGCDRLYLVIGRARLYQGHHWPMVVGFHSVPDYKAEIDWMNL